MLKQHFLLLIIFLYIYFGRNSKFEVKAVWIFIQYFSVQVNYWAWHLWSWNSSWFNIMGTICKKNQLNAWIFTTHSVLSIVKRKNWWEKFTKRLVVHLDKYRLTIVVNPKMIPKNPSWTNIEELPCKKQIYPRLAP